jgi:hypothetical protein
VNCKKNSGLSPALKSCDVMFNFLMYRNGCYTFTRCIAINIAHLYKVLNRLINDLFSTESTNLCCFRCVQFNFLIRYRLDVSLWYLFASVLRFSNWQHSQIISFTCGERTDDLLEPGEALSRLIDKPRWLHKSLPPYPSRMKNIYNISRILNNRYSLITIRSMLPIKHSS